MSKETKIEAYNTEGVVFYEDVYTHKINWDKVNTLEDIISILQTFNLTFNPHDENTERIKHLLKPIKNK